MAGVGNDAAAHILDASAAKALDAGVDVQKEDAERASAHTDTKKEAVDRAREVVGNQGGSEIRIANKDGNFIDSDTVQGPKHTDPPARDRK